MIIENEGIFSLAELGAASTGQQILYLSGTGSTELGYFDDFGTWVILTDGDVSAPGQYHVFGGGNSPVSLKIGAGAKLSVIVQRLK